MNASVELLAETSTALRQALERQDWGMIGKLDRQCRMVVEDALQQAEDTGLVRQRIEELSFLYRELISACQTEQRRIGAELRQRNQARQGAQVYQLFG